MKLNPYFITGLSKREFSTTCKLNTIKFNENNIVRGGVVLYKNKFCLVLIAKRPQVIYLRGKLHNPFVRLKFKIITYFKY